MGDDGTVIPVSSIDHLLSLPPGTMVAFVDPFSSSEDCIINSSSRPSGYPLSFNIEVQQNEKRIFISPKTIALLLSSKEHSSTSRKITKRQVEIELFVEGCGNVQLVIDQSHNERLPMCKEQYATLGLLDTKS